MPRIPSANPDFTANNAPTLNPVNRHGLDSRKSFVPMAFQVTSPFEHRLALLPTALVMHVNPSNLSMNYTKKVERIQTRGGFVEQHWGDDLDEISADGSTGGFMNIRTGLAAVMRRRTIQYSRFRDLYDLYRNNGSVHDPYGNIVLQGAIMLMWDRGTYIGTFRQFEVEETDDSPYAFKLSWTFKVEDTILQLRPGSGGIGGPPAFQSQNALPSVSSNQNVNSVPTTSSATTSGPSAEFTASSTNAQVAGSLF